MEREESITVANEYLQALQNIANTADGKTVLAYLQSTYVDVSSISESSEITHYRLGQKELAQQLIMDTTSALISTEELTYE